MMGRIENKFLTLKKRSEKALIVYLTAGDPDLRTTEELVLALEAAGVDIIEIGVPFSDPTADGPVIQAASQRALKAGTNLPLILEMVASLRRSSDIPVVLFGYFNPILSYGCRKFAKSAKSAGVDGILVVDLPPEEATELRRYTDPVGLDFIVLAAPTTDAQRVERILSNATGFLYYVSITGVTGTTRPRTSEIRRDIRKFKGLTDLPLAIGFGISLAEDAAKIAPLADGIVIGSAFMKLIEENTGEPNLVSRVASLAKKIKASI